MSSSKNIKKKCKHNYRVAYTQSLDQPIINRVGIVMVFYCIKCLRITRKMD